MRKTPKIILASAGLAILAAGAIGCSGAATPKSAAKASPAAGTDTSGASAPATSAAPAPAPATLLSLKGNGSKQSKTFTTGGEWTIGYTFDCSGFLGGKGNFQVYVYDDKGSLQDLPVNALDTKATDESPIHAKPGAHYLKINSECDWTVTVTG